MSLTTEELLTLHLRQRSFELALDDQRVQGALIAADPGGSPRLAVCYCCCYPTVSLDWCADCAICDWESDNFGDTRAAEVCGANNPYSLLDARRNFIDGHTKSCLPDPRYQRAMEHASERERIIEAYDALLPDVHPWAFIGVLPRLNALYAALRERRFPNRNERKRRNADRSSDPVHDREVWESVARGRLPFTAMRSGLPSGVGRKKLLFRTTVAEVAARFEALLDRNVPPVEDSGTWYHRWSADGRSVCIRASSIGSLTIDVTSDDGEHASFDPANAGTAEEIARHLAAVFSRDQTTA